MRLRVANGGRPKDLLKALLGLIPTEVSEIGGIVAGWQICEVQQFFKTFVFVPRAGLLREWLPVVWAAHPALEADSVVKSGPRTSQNPKNNLTQLKKPDQNRKIIGRVIGSGRVIFGGCISEPVHNRFEPVMTDCK